MKNSIPVLYSNISECCGCAACADACKQKAISLDFDEFGFRYPKIDESKCVRCGRCMSVCDFSKADDFSLLNEPQKGYAAVISDKKILKSSASGGVFYAVAKYVIDNNGYVFGCVMTDSFTAKHTVAKEIDELSEMQNSKYIQSDTEGIYTQVSSVLRQGRIVLFVGTPCQIAALYRFLGGHKYDNLITLDLICHGVTSPVFFQKYIKYMEKIQGAQIIMYNFRTKKYGWGKNMYELILQKNNRIFTKCFFGGGSIFHAHYLQGDNLRPCDFICKYARKERVGDITIGDFWGLDDSIRLKVNNGVSCCLANTNRGVNILESVGVNIQEVQIEKIVNGNAALRIPMQEGKSYHHYQQCFINNDLDAIARELSGSTSKKLIIKSYIKAIIPTRLFVKAKTFVPRMFR